jgi:predicted RNase H-like HicB family nuclease
VGSLGTFRRAFNIDSAGKTDLLVEWMNEVREREDEVVKTFQSEGLETEAAFLEHADDGDYLVYFMEAEDLREVYGSFGDSEHDIDEEHKEVMENVLEDSEESGARNYELLYHMVNPDRS